MSALSSLAKYRHSIKGAAHLETTQLQLINLELFKARYQERWPKVRARIFDTCEQFITRRMGPDDVVLRANNGFIVLPGPSRSESAEAFTTRIELELKAFFLGTDYLKELGLQTDTVHIAVAELFGALQSTELDKAAAAHERAAVSPEPPSPPLTFSPFTLTFEPLLAVTSGYIALHQAQPVGRVNANGPLGRGHLLCPASGGPALRMEFDREVVMSAAGHWKTAMARRAAGNLAVSVHYETLATVKYRLPYMASVNALDSAARAGLLLHIVGLPMDAPSGTITEVCRIAGTLTRRIMVQIDPRKIRLDRFDDGRVSIFSLPMPPMAALTCANGSVSQLVERLSSTRRMLAIHGCDSPAQLAAALAVGPDYVSGLAIGPDVDTPPPPYRLRLAPPSGQSSVERQIP